jgi:hypothetical protein
MGWTKPPKETTEAYADPMETPTDTSVDPIAKTPDEPRSAFRAVYTAFDEDLEVEIVERVPAAESPHQYGHVVIDRPDWDTTRKALTQNVRVDVVDMTEK